LHFFHKIIVRGCILQYREGAKQAGMPMIVEGEETPVALLEGPGPQGFGPLNLMDVLCNEPV
jgi:hypothetical protein